MADPIFLKENEKHALKALRERLEALYGSRLRQMVLYGSKARGESTDESDIDVLVVVENLENPRQACRRIISESSPIDLEHNVFLSVHAVDAEYFEKAISMPFYANVRNEGIPL